MEKKLGLFEKILVLKTYEEPRLCILCAEHEIVTQPIVNEEMRKSISSEIPEKNTRTILIFGFKSTEICQT